MPQTNTSIINSYLLSATSDFQQRIPDPTQSSLSRVAHAMFDPMNNDIYEDFTGTLLRVIGEQISRTNRWYDPLRVFKQSSMRYGRTIEEIATKWVNAHAYQVEPSEILKVFRPESLVAYHSEDSRLKYPLTIQRDLLESAFYDEYGISNYLTSVFNAAYNAAEYDEYNIIKQRIADHAYSTDLGFYQVHFNAVPSDEATAKGFLTSLRAYAGKLRFPSTLYNAQGVAGVPTFAAPEDLVLLITPEVQAVLDVQALAAMFNIDRGDIPYRIIQIDSFPVDGAFALLCSRDFFIARDTLNQVREWEDPDTLNLQWRLHKWGIFSTSPFAPAILFTTGTATTPATLTQTTSGLSVTGPSWALPGDDVQLTVELQGSLATNPAGLSTAGYGVRPNSARFELLAATYELDPDTSEPTTMLDPIALDSKTYIDDDAVLHVSPKMGAGPGVFIRVRAFSTDYIDGDPAADAEYMIQILETPPETDEP